MSSSVRARTPPPRRRFVTPPPSSNHPGASHQGSEARRPLLSLPLALFRPGAFAVAAVPTCAAASAAPPALARAAALDRLPAPRSCFQCLPCSNRAPDSRSGQVRPSRRRACHAAGLLRRRQPPRPILAVRSEIHGPNLIQSKSTPPWPVNHAVFAKKPLCFSILEPAVLCSKKIFTKQPLFS